VNLHACTDADFVRRLTLATSRPSAVVDLAAIRRKATALATLSDPGHPQFGQLCDLLDAIRGLDGEG
jgi:hypothetical protein